MSDSGAVSGDVSHLLGIRPDNVLLELSSRCNLRCIYCAVSQPDYVGLDLELDRQRIVDEIVALGPLEFQISGHGETSLVKGWEQLAWALLERGVALTMISHLNKEMSEDEIAVLARLKFLTVSCDTPDADLYRKLRRGGRQERVTANIRRIMQLCERDGLPRTHVAINCTATHLAILGVPDLVEWAADLGCASVALTNLVEYPEIPGVEKPLHPTKVDPVGALEAVRRGRAIAQARGLEYYPMGDLEASLEVAARERLATCPSA